MERHLDGWRKFHMTKECAKGTAADSSHPEVPDHLKSWRFIEDAHNCVSPLPIEIRIPIQTN